MFLHKIILLIFAATIFAQSYSQDVHYSQFYSDVINLNPALAGAAQRPRLNLNYRNQYPGISSAYVTYSASYDQSIEKIHGGIGVRVLRDEQGGGSLSFTGVDFAYAYAFNLTRLLTIRAGLQTSVIQRKLDWNNLVFSDMIDPVRGVVFSTNETPAEPTAYYLDFSTGIVGYSRKTYFGIAVHHLANMGRYRPDGENQFLPVKYTIHFGTSIDIDKRGLKNKELKISPNILFQQQQKSQQLCYGLYTQFRSLICGMWVRQNFTPSAGIDAIVLLAGFEFTRFKLGYSYDLTVSKMIHNTYGSHEISLGVRFEPYQKNRKFKAISCPEF